MPGILSRPSVHHKLLLIKRKHVQNKSMEADDISVKLLSEFEVLHPEGVKVYVDNLLSFYSDHQRYLANKFTECTELLSSVQDRRNIRLKLNVTLEELKASSDGVFKKEEDLGIANKLIPEEKIMASRPNIIQEVKDAVTDPTAGGINENNLNKLELHLINMHQAFVEVNYWLRGVLLCIKGSVGNRRQLLLDIKDMLFTLSIVLKNPEDNTSNQSVERDALSTTRHSSQMKIMDPVADNEPWELSTVEELLEVDLTKIEKRNRQETVSRV